MRKALLALSVLLAAQLQADVFWRIPRRADSVLQELGGSRVYATDVQINGVPGTLSAYVFGASSAQVSEGLTRRLGLDPAAFRSGALATGAEKGRVTRFIVLPSAAGEEACATLSISQSTADAARSLKAPAEWPASLPALAATPVFSAVCAVTRSAFVTAETGASPESAVQEAADVLRRDGWTEAVPSTPAFRMFSSGRKTCLVFASRSGKTGSTSISLLQREGATP